MIEKKPAGWPRGSGSRPEARKLAGFSWLLVLQCTYSIYNVSGGIVTNTCGDRTRVLPGS